MMVISPVYTYFVLIGFITICVSEELCHCAYGTEPGICESETCLTGCKIGWYGPRCSKRCSPKCQASVCEQTDGSCTFGCKYSARGKSRKCASVRWKENKRSSNGRCIRRDSITNKCECCQTNFRGDNCQLFCDKCSTYEHAGKNICKYMCKPGYYGFTCKNICPQNCARGNSGDPLCEETSQHRNGGAIIKCSSGCQQGYFGELCSKICSKRCKNNTCYQGDGTCVDCPDNFYHGMNCDLPCSSRCLQSICHRNGTCIKGCKDSVCEEVCPSNCAPGPDKTRPCSVNENGSMQCVFQCQNGYYGLECDKRCMETCHTCNQISGVCLTCERGWYDEFCNRTCSIKCREGTCFRNGTCKRGCTDVFYGYFCSETCGRNCLNSKCHGQLNGTFTCTDGCVEGFQGNQCNEHCQLSANNKCVVTLVKPVVEKSGINSVALTLSLSLVFVVVLAALITYKFRKEWILRQCSRQQRTKQDSIGGEIIQQTELYYFT